jgi:peptidoglycan/LPS O-acetylase OafA/YrhL
VLIHAFTLPGDRLDQTGPWSGVSACVNRVACRLWIGVPIFYVISGYCIGAAADAHRRHQRPIHEFFVCRLRRIYLPYFVALALTGGLAAVFDLVSAEHRLSEVGVPNPATLSAANWLGNLTLTEGLLSGLPGHVVRYQLLPAWTLCHEVQFYAISGVFLLVAARNFFLAVGALTVLGVPAVAVAARVGFQLPPGCVLRGTWLMFAMGLAVYWQIAAGTRRARWLTLALLTVPLLWSLCHPQSLITSASNNTQCIFVAAITALLLVLLHPFDLSLSSRTIAVPFAKLGKISFSVYLLHFPIVRFCDMQRAIWLGQDPALGLLVLLGSIIVSVGAGELFYRWVERRTLGRSGKKDAQWASGDLLFLRVTNEQRAEQGKVPVRNPRSPQGQPTAPPDQPLEPTVSEPIQARPAA